jgi:hypothetical protein
MMILQTLILAENSAVATAVACTPMPCKYTSSAVIVQACDSNCFVVDVLA